MNRKTNKDKLEITISMKLNEKLEILFSVHAYIAGTWSQKADY